MESKPLLTIGEEELSWSKSLKYLQASGKLQSFITEIVGVNLQSPVLLLKDKPKMQIFKS